MYNNNKTSPVIQLFMFSVETLRQTTLPGLLDSYTVAQDKKAITSTDSFPYSKLEGMS